MTERSVQLVIPTHRRNDTLLSALKSVRSLSRDGIALSVSVIDNSASREAAAVVPERLADIPVDYIHEPSPGISAVRNRGLREVLPSAEFVAWIDDDEVVTRLWLQEAVKAADLYAADVVAGPVLPLFGPSTPEWIQSGGHWRRRRYSTGSRLEEAASGNVVIRAKTLARHADLVFDERLNFSGGEDKQYFRQLKARGASIVWCDEAIVFEHVLAERASIKWLMRRAMQIGAINTRHWRSERSFMHLALGATVRVLIGGMFCAVEVARTRSWPGARALNMLGHGLGMWRMLLGSEMQAYKQSHDES